MFSSSKVTELNCRTFIPHKQAGKINGQCIEGYC
jgi:hypothetical protein